MNKEVKIKTLETSYISELEEYLEELVNNRWNLITVQKLDDEYGLMRYFIVATRYAE